jgi:hypothetical protein
MDKDMRYALIAGIGSETWRAVVEELKEREKNAFEGVLEGVSSERVAGRVQELRSLHELPQRAADKLKRPQGTTK